MSYSQSDQKNKGISKGAKLTFNYSVFPDPLPPKQNYPSISADQRPGSGCLFTLGIILGLFAGALLQSWLALFAVVGSFLGIEFYLDNKAGNESLDRKIKDWEIQKKKDLEKEAYQLSIKLNGMLKRSANLVIHDLPGALLYASEQIEIAKKEYNANAYSPFWDCIENAVKKLDFYIQGIKDLSMNTHDYYFYLKDKNHNFPAFIPAYGKFADIEDIIKELQLTIRKGQTNFKFANIWEHRQTRKVLILGFRTLGEGIANLATVTQNSMSQLNSSISSDMTRLVEGQIRNRSNYDDHAKYQEYLLREQNHNLNKIRRKLY